MRFGRLVAQARAENCKHGNPRWACLCDCGKTKIAHGSSLRAGNVKSCGCLGKINRTLAMTKHNMSRDPLYYIWASMKKRCNNKKTSSYPYYGGRGISVCESWEKFENFLADMGGTWREGLELDRIDNDGNYEPDNCRWVTHIENSNNRSNAKRLETPWGRISIMEAAEKSGIPQQTLRMRIRRGCAIENLFQPVQK